MLNIKNTSAYRHPHSNRPDRSDLRFRPQVDNKIDHQKKDQSLDATIHVHRAFVTIATRPIHDKRLLLCPCYSSSEVPFSFLLFTFYCLEFAIVSEDLCLYGSGHLCFHFSYKSSSYLPTTTLAFPLCIYVYIFAFHRNITTAGQLHRV